MDWKLELVAVPVSDVDRSKASYVDRVGFNADHDHQVNEDVRFVQLIPPGSACSDRSSRGMKEGLVLTLAAVLPSASARWWCFTDGFDRRR